MKLTNSFQDRLQRRMHGSKAKLKPNLARFDNILGKNMDAELTGHVKETDSCIKRFSRNKVMILPKIGCFKLRGFNDQPVQWVLLSVPDYECLRSAELSSC
jgi:hypothetical protein